MAGGGFKRRLVGFPIADVKADNRCLGDIEEVTVHTFKAYCSSINDLARQYHKRMVDSPEDNIMLKPC